MKVIVWEKPDGSVALTQMRFPPDETEAETLARVQAEEAPNFPGATMLVLDDADLPDDYFFEAWRIVATRLDVDLPAARRVRLATIARVRKEILGEQDDEIFDARVAKDAAREAAAIAKRQKAEAVADKIDLDTINSPSDLRNYWPPDIERRLAARGR